MANGQLRRILRRGSDVDAAESELLQMRVLARLQGRWQAVVDADTPGAVDVPGSTDVVESAIVDPGMDDRAAFVEPVTDEPEGVDQSVPVAADMLVEPASVASEVVNRPGPTGIEMVVERTIVEPDVVDRPDPVEPDVVGRAAFVQAFFLEATMDLTPQPQPYPAPETLGAPDVEADPSSVTGRRAAVRQPRAASPRRTPAPHKTNDPAARLEPPAAGAEPPAAPFEPPAAGAEPPAAAPEPPADPPRRAAPRRRAALPQPAGAAGPTPYCPYCVLPLDPPPDSSRRCVRCRERIIVRHVDGRAVYITEAAVAIFEAERRRVANSGRWTRELTRWLTAAAAVEAPPEKIARLGRAPISEEVVASARSLYFTTMDRAYRAAKRERRWEDASRIMRDHAQVLFKVAGSPIPPPDECLEAHRLGATAALRGLEEMSRVAELVSGTCCEICRADDGGLFKIAVELRQPRLPHAGCPKGLCRCDWFLAVRDQSLVRRHLRRKARTGSAVRGSPE